MIETYSLFVLKRAPKAQGSVLCTGIIVPTTHAASTPVWLNGPATAFVNGDPHFPVTWDKLGVFLSGYHSDDDEWIRMFACSQFFYEITGEIEAINPPCFLTPHPHCQPRVVEAHLDLHISSLFQTADFQGYIWLKTTGQVAAPFIFGEAGIDQALLHRSRQIRPSAGDMFPFVAIGAEETAGVAELRNQLDGDAFLANLWLPLSNGCDLVRSKLISRTACEIEGMTGIFQASLGQVRG